MVMVTMMALGLGCRRIFLVRLMLVVAVAAAVASGVPTTPGGNPGLAVGFYNQSCPNAEELVLAEMRDIVAKNRTLAPALLRFMLHDCFVRLQYEYDMVVIHADFADVLQGCDGSIMLKSRSKKGERDAIPSYSLQGYEEIERIKAKLEAECPLTVSCADIIVMAARDAVFLSNGPWYPVETGRRDGKVSSNYDANNDIPGPNTTIVDLKIYFSFKGLGWKDIVVLSGSHTIGRAQCSTFAGDRLYNFTGRGVQDPTLNKTYAADLRQRCEPGLANDTTMVEMDPASPYAFDLSYYRDVVDKKGLFTSDQTLLDDRWTREYVERMAAAESPDEYFRDYAEAMTNMGRIEVLTGDDGEIREVCTAYVDDE